jgi:hypothetical protein
MNSIPPQVYLDYLLSVPEHQRSEGQNEALKYFQLLLNEVKK